MTSMGMGSLPEDAVRIGNQEHYEKVYDKNGKWVGIFEWHRNPALPKEWCVGFVGFRGLYVANRKMDLWEVQSFSPLTLSPSILCRTCEHHGYVREDKWEGC